MLSAAAIIYGSAVAAMIAALLAHERLVPRRRPWLWWGSRAVAVLLAFVVALFATQRYNMYQPNTAATVPAAGDRMLESRTADGLLLRHDFHPPAPGRPVVVVMHGNGGRADDWALHHVALAAAGYGVVMLEYRGDGGNPGSPTEAGLYADAESVLAALAAEGHPTDELILWGHSLGSGVAVEMAARHRVAGVVLEAPFTSAVAVAARRFGWLPLDTMMWDQFRSIDKIGRVAAPLLVLHGDADTLIPPAMGRTLADAAPKDARFALIPGAGHEDVMIQGGWPVALEFLNGLD